MGNRRLLWSFLAALAACLAAIACSPSPACADLSHARIIRLSLVQGDVRFTRDAHGDPLTDGTNLWEAAVLNLPIRQGYVLATDHGRAAVEFENGAMAFLNENTVVEFFDLSLDNGAHTTRLVLRQGTASFYVNPSGGDYFSVTGGDFTAEATARATFRLDNFDDGSTVDVFAGHVDVLRKNHAITALAKGQSLSMTVGENSAANIGRAADSDDFDRWVSGHVQSAVTATNAGLQYSNSSTYTSGFGDLYTYGSWIPIAGFGYGWQPFGVGLGWSPFNCGGWFQDSAFGWGFIGNQPWGWLPYHYGGWFFHPGIGWVWAPGTIGYAGLNAWRPATVTWVRAKNGATGFVPVHPSDIRGKAPINLAQGVYSASNAAISQTGAAAASSWKVQKAAPGDALRSTLAPSVRPELLSRTMLSAGPENRVVRTGNDSRIVFDASQHRFVNSNSSAISPIASSASSAMPATAKSPARTASAAPGIAAARRNDSMPARRSFTPAPSASARSFSGSTTWGGAGSRSSGSSSASSARSTTSSSSASRSSSSGGRH